MDVNAKELAKRFWEIIDSADFDRLAEVFQPDAVIALPNTREEFPDLEHYIQFNKAYPGRWRAELKQVLTSGSEAVSAALVSDGKNSFYCTAWMEIQAGKIQRSIEYWGDNGDAPDWRASYVRLI